MTNALTQFDEARRKRVADAVAAAEQRTSAEVVPVVAASSGRYDRAEDVAGLWVGLIAMTLAWALLPRRSPDPGSWGGWPAWADLVVLIAAVVAGFILGAWAAGRAWPVRRLFTPPRQMREEVQERARHAFFDARVHHTQRRCGLLIFVSLYERMAVILGDQAVVQSLGQPAIDELCSTLTARLRNGDLTDALCACIDQAGANLAAAMPSSTHDRNEVPDALVTIEGY